METNKAGNYIKGWVCEYCGAVTPETPIDSRSLIWNIGRYKYIHSTSCITNMPNNPDVMYYPIYSEESNENS